VKKLIKLAVITAFTAVIGFSFVACADDGGNDNGSNSAGAIGPRLELSGQVYTRVDNEVNYTVSYPVYNGDLTLQDGSGGIGMITAGKLSFIIETPKSLSDHSSWSSFFYGYDNITVSNTDVKVARLNIYKLDNASKMTYQLFKENTVYNIGDTSGSATQEEVAYFYVDGDVIISGQGKTEPMNVVGSDGKPLNGIYTRKTNDFNLSLKEGWNAVYTKTVSSASYPSGQPSKATRSTNNVTISLKDPPLRWVLRTYQYQ